MQAVPHHEFWCTTLAPGTRCYAVPSHARRTWRRSGGAVDTLLTRPSVVHPNQGLERNTVASVSIPVVERLCCSIVQATYEAKALGTALDEEYGSVLEYKGRPYPGEGDQVVGVSHLIRVLEYMQKYDGPVKLLL